MPTWFVERPRADVPLHFTAFHPDFKMLDVPRTPAATLTRAREIALRNGVRYAYTGNVVDVDGGSPPPTARRASVDRARLVPAWRLPASRGWPLRELRRGFPGVFADGPGGWGRRRLAGAPGVGRCAERSAASPRRALRRPAEREPRGYEAVAAYCCWGASLQRRSRR